MQQLKTILQRIDRKGYKAYQDLRGVYQGEWFQLYIDHVQSDPFASLSRIRVILPRKKTAIRQEWFSTPHRQIALEDYLSRKVSKSIEQIRGRRQGTGTSGLVFIDTPGQEMLKRTSIKIDGEQVEVRLSVGLPAIGRKILGKQATLMLCERIPLILKQSILSLDPDSLQIQLQLADQQAAIRNYMREKGWVAFIANGSILPRESGVSDKPMPKQQVIPFQSPKELEVEIPIPFHKPIRGMAIPKGITLIVGGGYHGKSTLLQAIERGVYSHIQGDGREFVLTDETACKIRAEDGRSVEKVNISPFISNLPFEKDTQQFSTEDASGSTSQATSIIEALEMGSRVLLMDEDTSATNFMIRDARMQKLVQKSKEPITPFIDKARLLYEEYGVSTILVIGGSGDYLEIADTVIMMESYCPSDVTRKAHQIAKTVDHRRQVEGGNRFGRVIPRIIQPQSLDAKKGRKEKMKSHGIDRILYGRYEIDLSAIEQLVDPSQTRAIAEMMRYLSKKGFVGKQSFREAIDALYEEIDEKGLDFISPFVGQHPGDLAYPRKFEFAAAINRFRGLKVLCSVESKDL